MSEKNSRIVTIKDDKGAEQEIFIRPITAHDRRMSQKMYNTILSEAIASGAPLRIKVPKIIKDQELWSDGKQKEYEKILTDLDEKEMILAKGGIKKSEARQIALEIQDLRTTMAMMLTDQQSIYEITAEAQAEDERMNYLVSVCAVFNRNHTVAFYKSYEDYINRIEKPYSAQIARKFAELYHGYNNELSEDLPEIKFLKKFGYLNDEGRLINEDGDFVNREGRLVDEKGRLIEKCGDKTYLVDSKGHRLDDKGNYLIDNPKPFLDEEGNDIVEKVEQGETPDTPEACEEDKLEPTPRPPKRRVKKGKKVDCAEPEVATTN